MKRSYNGEIPKMLLGKNKEEERRFEDDLKKQQKLVIGKWTILDLVVV